MPVGTRSEALSNTLDAGVCGGGVGSRGVGGEKGSRLKTYAFVRASTGIDLQARAMTGVMACASSTKSYFSSVG